MRQRNQKSAFVLPSNTSCYVPTNVLSSIPSNLKEPATWSLRNHNLEWLKDAVNLGLVACLYSLFFFHLFILDFVQTKIYLK